MRNKINLYLLEYALGSLLRSKGKNIFITIVFTLLVFLVTAIFSISNSIKYELSLSLDKLPQITLQQLKGGKTVYIESAIADEISSMAGVKEVYSRVWGYYYFTNGDVTFTILGVDPFDKQYTQNLKDLVKDEKVITELEKGSMIVGEGVKKALDWSFYKDSFNFILPSGMMKTVNIAGTFKSDIELQSNDMVIVSKDLAYEILGLEEEYATDMIVKVSNPTEIPKIVEKINLAYPSIRVITNEDFMISYENIFDYKSGAFLVLFIISLFTFFMIIYDKASGLSSSEKKEIGIQKALGWSIEDILKQKFYESIIISISAYIMGVVISMFYVYGLNAPILRYIFEGYSRLKTSFELPFVLDFQTLSLVFFITVPVYIAATIFPSWRTATLDADEVIR